MKARTIAVLTKSYAVAFFANMYGLGTNVPVHARDTGREPLWAEHGVSIASNEWHGLSLEHTITTHWARSQDRRGFFVGSTKYEVALRARMNDTLALTAEHMSWHNADISIGMRQYNRIGVEINL